MKIFVIYLLAASSENDNVKMTTINTNQTEVSAPPEPKKLEKLEIVEPATKFAATKEVNEMIEATPTPTDMNKVGQSVFYDCLDLSPAAEKQDFMKPERSDTEEESE